MASLRDVMTYVCEKYPHGDELSNARLTKMIYLADWRAALELGRQITRITWQFNHYGPFVHDVMRIAQSDSRFEVVSTTNYLGGFKEIIQLRDKRAASGLALADEDRKVLDEVMQITAPKYWEDFIRLVYSTYPILTQPRYSELDLVELAQHYRANQSLDDLAV